MLIIPCLILLLVLTCGLTDDNNQNELPIFSNNYNKRIKRYLSGKFSKSKSRFNKEELLKTSQDSNPFSIDNKEKQAQGGPKKGYTQQELAEIRRILLKKDDDYYGILNINKVATTDVIEQAYRTLTLRVHPDKYHAPGATEATQRLNKARTELLKQYDNQNAFTARKSTLNNNDDQETFDIHGKSNSITTISQSSLKKTKQPSKTNATNNKSKYIAFTLVLLIIGIIISIIYWKKQHHASTNTNVSKKQKTSQFYDSPGSTDSDKVTWNENNEASIASDEE